MKRRRDGHFEFCSTHGRAGHGLSKIVIQRTDEPLQHRAVEFAAMEVGDDIPSTGQGLTTDELVERLDTMGVPTHVGRPTAAKALQQTGAIFRTPNLAEAMKQRKARG